MKRLQLDLNTGLIIAKYNSINLIYASSAFLFNIFEGHTYAFSNNYGVCEQAFLTWAP